MPLKLRLKKSRRYNVLSKNFFVISVELLDNTIIECTLTAESTGHECLDHVCQRLELQESDFFGLRYVSKKFKLRWVDLDKPLKKQLDKYAHETYLYFGVMYYVPSVHSVKDEMTRYQHFLQLKSDVIEGRLGCTAEQAILLASYSLQAEFGDHNPERHTLDYLKDFVLLPKNMTTDEQTLEEMTHEVVNAHKNLQGVLPALAELYYLIESEQLEGYGQECFAAKDESSGDLLLGASFAGIFIKHMNGQPTVYFKWNDISNLVHNKRFFGIESLPSRETVQFQMEDPETAKYVWKFCILQHKFHRLNKLAINPNNREVSVDGRRLAIPDIQSSAAPPSVLYDVMEHSTLMQHPQTSFENLQNQLNQSRAKVDPPSAETQYHQMSSMLNGSNYSLNSSTQQMIIQNSPANSNPSIQSREDRTHLLPSYRSAPDYETAVRLQTQSTRHYPNLDTQNSSVQVDAPNVVYTQNLQPDSVVFTQSGLHRHTPTIPQQTLSYMHYNNYMNLSRIYGNNLSINPYTDALDPNIYRSNNMMVPCIHATYSTPELNLQGLPQTMTSDKLINEVLYYKPPPPYPRSSSSTPDLASEAMKNQHAINSSPDLVSKRQLGLLPTIRKSPLDASVENLAIKPESLHMVENKLHNEANDDSSSTHSDATFHAKDVLSEQEHSDTEADETAPPTSGLPLHQITVSKSNRIEHKALIHNIPSSISPSYLSTGIENQAFADSDSVSSWEKDASSISSSPRLRSDSHKDATISIPNSFPISSTKELKLTDISNSSPLSSGKWKQTEDTDLENSELLSGETACSNMGPMMLAAMNGLTLSRPDLLLRSVDESRAPKDGRRQMLESRLLEGQVFIEFEQISKKRLKCDFSTAMLPENIERNRFKDVLPYEDTRVKLTPTPTNKTGYINASHVSIWVGHQEERNYIATQGPLANTVDDFWQMIWDHNICLIAMLTELKEQGREKSFTYWPQTEENNKLKLGNFQIVRQFSNNSLTYVTSGLTLKHLPSNNKRTIWHIQYTDWPDRGCPDDLHGFLCFMDEISSVRRHAISQLENSKPPPIVVHCSAGAGRTGVAILTDIMTYCLDHNESITVPKALAHMRQQRMHLVQTVTQYKFTYQVLIQYLKNSRLI